MKYKGIILIQGKPTSEEITKERLRFTEQDDKYLIIYYQEKKPQIILFNEDSDAQVIN